MRKNYTIIIHFVLPLKTFYQSVVQRSDVYKSDAFVTSWRFYNRAWQPQRHDRLPETSGTLWIHRGALTNQRCSLAAGCGITYSFILILFLRGIINNTQHWFICRWTYPVYCCILLITTSRTCGCKTEWKITGKRSRYSRHYVFRFFISIYRIAAETIKTCATDKTDSTNFVIMGIVENAFKPENLLWMLIEYLSQVNKN